MMKQASLITPLILLVLLFSSTPSKGHVITEILADKPEFSLYIQLMTAAYSTGEIYSHQPVTFCVFNDATFRSNFSSKYPNIHDRKRILALHVLLHYIDPEDLSTLPYTDTDLAFYNIALAVSMFKPLKSEPDFSYKIPIVKVQDGGIGFGFKGTTYSRDVDIQNSAVSVRSNKKIPNKISVIEISDVVVPPGFRPHPRSKAEPPTYAPPLPVGPKLTGIAANPPVQKNGSVRAITRVWFIVFLCVHIITHMI